MRTALRNFRCHQPLWDAALAKAHAEGRSLSAVLVEFLEHYTNPKGK
jgi:hypothetical protein